jgi:large subunit ribosomal protein L25
MAQVQLTADTRTKKGKEAARQLRSQGLLPAVLYGGESGNIPIAVNAHDFHQIVTKAGGENMLIDLTVKQTEGEKQLPVIIKDVQIDPVKHVFVHADFLEVTMGQVIEIQVPIELQGTAQGVKEGGVMEFLHRSLTVECLPSQILDQVSLDISSLDIGDSLTVADISLGDDYRILDDLDTVVTTVTAPSMAEEEEEEELEEELAEPEVIQKGKQEEEEF